MINKLKLVFLILFISKNVFAADIISIDKGIFCFNEKITVKSIFSDTLNYALKWQYKVNANDWESIHNFPCEIIDSTWNNQLSLSNFDDSISFKIRCLYIKKTEITDTITSNFLDDIKVLPQITAAKLSPISQTYIDAVSTVIAISTPAGGSDGKFTYQWQKSTDKITFTPISGVSGLTYPTGLLTDTTFYRVVATSDFGCGTVISDTATVFVNDQLSAGTIGARQIICNTGTIYKLQQITSSAGGNGTYAYLWQESTDSVTFTDITTAINNEYLPEKSTGKKFYRLEVKSDNVTAVSNVISITVLPAITAPKLSPISQTYIDAVSTVIAIITPAGGSDGKFTYQWQKSTDKIAFTPISGVSGLTYPTGLLTDTTFYRVVATSDFGCGTVISDTATVFVNDQLSAGTIGARQIICNTGTINKLQQITSSAGGNGTYAYLWQESTDSVTFTDITTAITNEYLPEKSTGKKFYRLEVKSDNVTAVSNIISITVLPSITSPKLSPKTQIINYNTAATISVNIPALGSDGKFTYQWQKSTDKITFTPISGVSGLTYPTGLLTDTTFYRVVATSDFGCGTVISDTATVFVNDQLSAGTIGARQMICNTGTINKLQQITSSAGGNGTYAYLWQESTDSVTFTDITTAITNEYLPEKSTGKKFYRLEVKSDNVTAVSNIISITVLPAITAPKLSPISQTYIDAVSTVIAISTPAGGSDGKFTYQWQKSTDKIAFTPISGVSGLSYPTGLLTDTTFYRVVATSDFGCGTVTSDTTTVFVYGQLSAGTIGERQMICNTGTINKLQQIITPKGGNGTYAYLWQQSTDSVTFTDITTAITNEYLPEKSTGKKFYRLEVKSDNVTAVSNIISITVLPAITTPKLSPISQTYIDAVSTVIAISTPAGGSDGKFTYQWQKSTDKITFTPISGVSGLSYPTGLLTDTTFYRVVATSDFGCGTVTSDTATVFVYGQLSAGTIGARQMICNTGTINKLQQIITPKGGNGTYAYLWQQSTDSVTFTDITTAITNEYLPTKSTGKKFYRLEVKSDNVTAVSNIISITVLPAITAPKLSPISQTYIDAVSTVIAISTPAGGSDGKFTYQWQKSTDKITFSPISGVSGLSYPTGLLTDTTFYRVVATSDFGCGTVTSDTATVFVYGQLSAGTIGERQMICNTGTINKLQQTITPKGGNGTYAYLWQQSTDSVTFTDITTAITNEYLPTKSTGKKFYRLAVKSDNVTDVSNIISITVLPSITSPKLSPKTQIINYNTAATISVSIPALGSDGKFTYQWQKSTDKITFTPISGVSGLSYPTGLLTDTAFYRVVATSDFGCGTVISDTATVFVYGQLSAGTIGARQMICNTGTINKLQQIITPKGGSGTYTYLWQQSTDSVNFTDITTAITNEYLPVKSTGKNFYRLTVKSDNVTVISNIISITVLPVITSPKLSPKTQTIYYNTAATISISTPAGGSDGKFTYQWQKSTDKITFTPISGASGLSYPTGLLTDTAFYRVVATSEFGCGSVISDTATVFVNDQLSAGTIGAKQIICNTGTISKLQQITTPKGGNETYAYLWQQSTDSVTFTDITTAITNEYLPVKTIGKNFYRLSVKSDNITAFSNIISITVLPANTSPKLSPKTQIINYNTAATISVSIPALGSDGKFTYQWQKSTDKITFTPISGVSGLSYPTGLLTDTAFYRVVATSDFGCGTVISDTATVYVYDQLSAGTIGARQMICNTGTINKLQQIITPKGGNGTYTYLWQQSTDSVNFTDITTAITNEYLPIKTTGKTFYRLAVKSNIVTAFSNIISITVLPVTTSPKLSPKIQSIFYNTAANISISTTASGSDGKFTYQWQKSNDKITFTTISGASGLSYPTGLLTDTAFYRVVATSDFGCGSVISDTATVFVNDQLSAGTIGERQMICNTGTINKLQQITSSAGGNGIYTYLWQQSTDSVTFTDITTSITNEYLPEKTTGKKFYRLSVKSDNVIAVSNIISITVLPVITAPKLSPISQTFIDAVSTVIAISTPAGGSDGKFTYQWQKSTDKITFSPISGTSGLNYPTGLLTNTTFYRVVATSDFGCGTVISDTATVFVNDQLSAGNIGARQIICNTGTINKLQQITSSAGGNGIYTYLWQQSTDSVTFTDITTSITNEYLPEKTTGKNFYRLSVKSDNITAFSNIISITVLPAITAPKLSPQTQTIYYNTAANISFGTPAGGSDAKFTYQWQKSTDKITFLPISGTSGLNYPTGLLTNTTFYRVVATSDFGCGTVISDTATVFVNDQLSAGTIGARQIICNTGTINKLQQITSSAGGNGIYTYLWQQSTDSITFTDITTAITNEYLPEKSTGKKFYRLSVKSDNVTAFSNVISITVLPVITAPTLSPISQTFIDAQSTVIAISTPAGGSDGNFTYQWQKSTDKITFTTISGVSGLSYTTGLISNTTYYRVIATSSTGCGTIFSDIAEVLVNPILTDIKEINGNKCVCSNQYADYSFTDTLNPDVEYKWIVTGGSIESESINVNKITVKWNLQPINTVKITITQTVKKTGYQQSQDFMIEKLTSKAPDRAEIIRKGISNILISKEKSDSIHYRWGYTSISNINETDTIADTDRRFFDYKTHTNSEINTDNFIYWVVTYYSNIKCKTVSTYNPISSQETPSISGKYLIYPNPAKNFVNIETTFKDKNTVEICIYSLSGSVIYQNTIDEVMLLNKRIELDLDKGIYLIQLTDNEKITTQKLVIK